MPSNTGAPSGRGTVDRCSRCAGSVVRMVFGPQRWCAPSRAGTTPASRRRRRWPSSPAASAPTQFATIDPEEFVDFQSTRPMVRLVDGVTRAIDWPEFEIHAVRIPRAPRDLVLLSGPEPAMRWRTFCAHRRRPGRGARDPDGGPARRAAGRRAALAAGRGHRACVRSRADPAAGALAADLRGPDRDRRRPARRVRRRRPAGRVAVGGGAALRRGRAEPEGRAGAAAAAGDRWSA